MIIKQLKIEDNVIDGIATTDVDIPKDLDKFKAVAVDTLLWQVSEVVKKASGGKISDLITAISKIQVLQMHLTVKNTTKKQIDELPQTAQDIITKMDVLYNAEYADSEKALSTIAAVWEEREKLYTKIPKVTSATSHEEVIEILNED